MKKIWIAVLVLATAAGAWMLLGEEGYTPRPLPPLRPSSDYASTLMVPALETPIPAGKSAVWCGAFQLAWNRLKTDLVKEPVRVRNAEPLCALLNASAFNDADLAPDSFYAAAGFARDGIVDRVRRDMRAKGVEPRLGDLKGLEAMAYAWLAASLRFKQPYKELKDGFVFYDGAGKGARVRGFGLGPDTRSQLRYSATGPDDFVVDLDAQSSPHQILLARMERPTSLAEAVASLKTPTDSVSGGETLLVPDVALGLLHRFRELEGEDKIFLNQALPETYLAEAQQSIQFRLDRGGAELKAEAYVGMKPTAAVPRGSARLVFDRPFLLAMKLRGASRPYFAVWVDNAELLDPR